MRSWSRLSSQPLVILVPWVILHIVGTQQCQEKRQEGKNEEKMDRNRGWNHPPQHRQLMHVWGKKKRTENKEKQKKETGSCPQPSYLDYLVASDDPHGSYGGPILKPPTHRKKYLFTYLFIYLFIWQKEGLPFNFQYIVDDEGTANFQTRMEETDSSGVVRGCYQVSTSSSLQREKNRDNVIEFSKYRRGFVKR